MLWSVGCASGSTPVLSPSPSVQVSSSSVAAPLNPLFERALQRAKEQLDAARLEDAAQSLVEARQRAGDNPKCLDDIAIGEATLQAYRGDFDKAAQSLLDRVPAAATRPGDETEFWLHNKLIFLREAQGDFAGMVIETEQMRIAGERSRFAPEKAIAFRLDYLWHRAHALRTLAESLSGTAREAVMQYAQEARKGFAQVAHDTGKSLNSIAILDEYFAMLHGNKAEMLAAARRSEAPHPTLDGAGHQVAVGLGAISPFNIQRHTK